ncbi:MAG TPA: hypothetical protein P5519_08020 [Spirochaetia bacterium]|nr:hypothetical protein [Spirochaetales bacterium]HRS65823.1 hypothetical protein [Spirochaetia bacterium]HOT59299.1 hypothetical protein [Spirochaetales bacterium]HPD81216.1 hypothetical protein [Spirochaetales bacterium]HQK33218.1 hypothetical protein [Spirochaetales bacterium]
MADINTIETFLIDNNIGFKELDPTTLYIEDAANSIPGLFIAVNDPIVVVKARVMTLPNAPNIQFFKKLLELNAKDLPHGAYGLDGDDVVLVDTLELNTLDKEELMASIDSISFALVNHYSILKKTITA